VKLRKKKNLIDQYINNGNSLRVTNYALCDNEFANIAELFKTNSIQQKA